MNDHHPIPYPHTEAEIAANPWLEITKDVFFEYLGCVPPHLRAGTAFAVGEALCHMDDGGIVDEMCVQVGDKFYCKPDRLSKFDHVRFANEVLKQLRVGEDTQQIISKKPTMDTFDVIFGSCTLRQAKTYLDKNPHIITNRKGMTIWWGAVRLS